MSIKYTNLTYNELRELAPKDKPFQMVVQSNPHGKGGKQTLWSRKMTKSDVNSSPSALQSQEYYIDTEGYGQYDIDDVDYNCNRFWKEKYKGTFDLIIHHFDDTTLERFKVGDEVEILDNIGAEITKRLFKILEVQEYRIGEIYYILDTSLICDGKHLTFSHNCLRKVVSKKIESKTITIGNKTYPITEELTNALKNLKEID